MNTQPLVNELWIQQVAFCGLTGYTTKAINCKRAEGKWLEGVHWKKAPDGHIMINLVAFNEWVKYG